MNRLRRVAIVTELTDQLRQRDSWCGETHIQKATYFLQELLEVPLDFDFLLYKHGPFSFDLRDELTAMRGDGLLEMQPQPYPYGPRLSPSPLSQALRKRFPKTLGTYKHEIAFVAEHLAQKGVGQLEKLATALYVILEERAANPASRVHELKPHVSETEAQRAVDDVNEMIEASGHD